MKSPACFPWPAKLGNRPYLVEASGIPKQTGIALITVLLIVFLASIAATSLAALQQMAIRRTSILQHQQQARLYALGAEQWAILALGRDRQQNEIDHLGEAWASLPSILPIQEGNLSLRIRDLQGCFNLNNLRQVAVGTTPVTSDSTASTTAGDSQTATTAPRETPAATPTAPSASTTETPTEAPAPAKSTLDADAEKELSEAITAQSAQAMLNQPQFQVLQRLLVSLELKPELAQAIADWIDADQEPLFPDGAEDSDYNVLTPPYLAANRSMHSISELRLVKGMDTAAYDKLAPLVCALPSNTPLNVNTAPAIILAALADDQDPKELENVLANRPAEGYQQVDEFLDAANLSVDASLKAQLSVASEYFAVQIEVQLGDGRAMLYSVLQRDSQRIRILRRSFGNQD